MNSADKLLAARQAQRDRALAIANERRREQAALKVAIKQRKIDVYALIEGTLGDQVGGDDDAVRLADRLEEVVRRWSLAKVLRAAPGIGPTKAQDILTAMNASPSAKLGSLTFERRKELSTLVRVSQTTQPR